LNATNQQDIARRIGMLLAPAFGARRFEIPAPDEGNHTLAISAPGATAQAIAPFQVSGRSVQVDSLQTTSGRLQPGDQITQPIWVQVVPADNAAIDSVEFVVDGRVTHVASEPYAILLDPEQLGDGSHQLTARITSQGRSGSFLSTSVLVPMDVFRTARTVVRSWGLIGVLVIAEAVIVTLFVRMAPARRGVLANTTDFPPSLRLNPLTGTYIAPELIEFPSRGR